MKKSIFRLDVIRSVGLRKCGGNHWIEWSLRYKGKAWNQRHIKISIDKERARGT